MTSPPVHADVYWSTSAGDWSVASNWGGALPGTFDTAYIINGGTATVSQLGGTCRTLSLGGSNDAGTVQMNGGSLAGVLYEYIGYSGPGAFTQSAGSNDVAEVYLGYMAGISGTYSLSDSAQLSAIDFEYVGNSGTGSFTQSGGTNHVGYLYLGSESAGSGTYSLSGCAVFLGGLAVGGSGTGSFAQSGGTNNASGLALGLYPGSSGTYVLSNGLISVSSSGNECVGCSGTGSFTQSGGTNACNGGFYLGYQTGGSGTYNLSGSGLLSVGSNLGEYIGYTGAGTGTFVQSGGTNNIAVGLFVGGSSGSSGTYYLSGGLLMAAREYVGADAATGNLIQSGGTNNTTSLSVAGGSMVGSGTYSLSGNGLLSVGNVEIVGANGTALFLQSGGTNRLGGTYPQGLLYVGSTPGASSTYNLSGSGLLLCGSEVIGLTGGGIFAQSGGTNSVSQVGLVLGYEASGSGTYNLSGSGLLSLRQWCSEFVGDSGTGSFTQSGGTHSVVGFLYLGYYAGSNGSYNLSGGQVSVLVPSYLGTSEVVGYAGKGSFTQSGGTHSVGSLVLAQSAGSTGTYNLHGGLLSLSALAQGSGSAAFNFGGGTFQAASSFSTRVPIVLDTKGSNGVFDTDGNTLTLAAPLSGPGGLQKTGSGTLILSASDSYTGGTTVSDGMLIVTNNNTVADGTSLTVGAGATLIFDPIAAGSTVMNSAVAAVPEPSTFLLLTVGIFGLLAYARRKRLASANG